MKTTSSAESLVQKLAIVADRDGLQEFDIYGLVQRAFSDVRQRYIDQLDRTWDAEFEGLRRLKVHIPTEDAHPFRLKTPTHSD